MLEIVRDTKFKALSNSDKEGLYEWMRDEMCDDNGRLCNLFHSDKRGSTASLTIKPNNPDYGTGFVFQIFKKRADSSSDSVPVFWFGNLR